MSEENNLKWLRPKNDFVFKLLFGSEEYSQEPYPDLMQIHFFELPKFVFQLKENKIKPEDRMAKWLDFLTNEEDLRWEEMAKEEPIIEKAVKRLKLASMDPETRMQYEAREKALKDIASIYGDGVEDGRIEGKLEGKIEGKQEVARKMLERGLDIEDIVELTGLSYSEVIELKKSFN